MRRVLSLAALSMLTLSASASAQRASASSSYSPSPEIGFDAGVTFALGNGGGTLIDIPAQRIRMGFFLSPALSVEPTFGLTSVSGGGTSFTQYNVGVGALYHFSASRASNQVYVRPFVSIQGVSTTGGGSKSDAYFGVGLGVKVPLRDRIASRFEANFQHGNGTDFIGLLAGLSFYTR